MRKIQALILILGLLFLLVTSFSYAQIHKVKVSELKEKVTDESPLIRKISKYQSSRITNPIFTNSPGTVVGSTWYEYQHNGTMSRMILLDPSEGVHFNWMNGLEDNPEFNRYVDYNYLDSTGTWLGAVHVTPYRAGGGFTGIAGILPDGREVLCFHQKDAKWPPEPWWVPWWSTLGIEKSVGGAGDFYRYDIPDSIPNADHRVVWPRAAIDSLNHIHVVMRAYHEPLVIDPFGYTRCYIDDTTLVCEAPGIDTLRILPDTLMNFPEAKLVAIFDSSVTISHTVITSPVSKKVAIIYTKYTSTGNSVVSNDVYYIESTNCGQDWIDAGGFETIEKHNITNYTSDDTIRAYHDVAGVYDYDDNLHILWNTHGYWEAQDSVTTDACFLWHWSQATGITLIADGWKPSRPGENNRTISKMSIGVNPANEYLYTIWTQFDISDTASCRTPFAPNDTFPGLSNGEIYASASSDGGVTWDVPRNLTNTHTPGCQAGECESDHWSSLAEVVNDTLHIQYINDKDAGGAIHTDPYDTTYEGEFTYNPVLYMKVPAWTPEVFPVRANFSGSPRSGYPPLSVQFSDSSIGDPIPTSWHWDFGDGNTDTVQNPMHTYYDAGYFDVKLVAASEADTDSVVRKDYINVYICGDVNGDGGIDLVDPIYLANYILKGGPAPASEWASDVNCDTDIDLVDAIIIAKYCMGIPGFVLNCCP